jgi:hypothetical protein
VIAGPAGGGQVGGGGQDGLGNAFRGAPQCAHATGGSYDGGIVIGPSPWVSIIYFYISIYFRSI